MMNFIWKDNTPLKNREKLESYLEDVIAKGENALGYGLWAMGYKVPIYFVPEQDIDAYGKKLREAKYGKVDGNVKGNHLDRLFDIFDEYPEDGPYEEDVILDTRRPPVKRVLIPDYTSNPLGLFFPVGPIEQKGPEILISYEKIKKQNPKKEDHITLFVLAHELGHAIMCADTSGIPKYNDWIEEPLANLISLEYLEAAGPSRTGRIGMDRSSRLEEAMDFATKQPRQYKLGLDLFLAKQQGFYFDWRRWRKAKWSMALRSKIHSINGWKCLVFNSANGLNFANLLKTYESITTPPFTRHGQYSSFVNLYSCSNISLREKAAFIVDSFINHDQRSIDKDGLIIVVAKDQIDAKDYTDEITALLAQWNVNTSILVSNDEDEVKNRFEKPGRNPTWQPSYRILVTNNDSEDVIWIRGVYAVYFDKDPNVP